MGEATIGPSGSSPKQSVLNFPFDAAPGPGEVAEVAPGICWLRMKLPFHLDHVNLWLLEDGEGWTVIDTGIATPETRQAWETVFATGLAGRPITRLLVTHFHPDHIGLSGWLVDRWRVPFLMSETEYLLARLLNLDNSPESAAEAYRFYHAAGLDPALAQDFADRGNPYPRRVPSVPRTHQRLQDGQIVSIGKRRWRVMTAGGHAPEHVSLYCEQDRIFIAGDQILPRISPNVSVWPLEPEGNPLRHYLDSLDRMRRELPSDTFVLPSHNLPFYGLWERAEDLLHHHRDRLSEVVAACVRPQTAAEVVPVLFRRHLDTHTLGFALGEALSHIRLLVSQNRLEARRRQDGVTEFSALGEAA
jgi:glyoxylase-like metal-dependent hydrolase (beta-lactamase superfamily II)